MSYSSNPIEHFRAAAAFIDRILKGASPAALTDRATHALRATVVLNLRTAKAQGVSFPSTDPRARRSSNRVIVDGGTPMPWQSLRRRITFHCSGRLRRR